MRVRPRLLATLSVAFTLSACSGGGDDRPVRDIGTGNSVLSVSARVETEDLIPNARDATGFITHYEVRVARGTTPVTTAAVSLGGVPLAHLDSGVYVGDRAGLPPDPVALDVAAEGDYVRGVALSPPGLHFFTRPSVNGETVALAAGQPLVVTWSRGESANEAELVASNFEGPVPDTGRFEVAPQWVGLAEPGEPCRLSRTNRMAMGGLAAGLHDNEIRIRLENELQFTAVQQ